MPRSSVRTFSDPYEYGKAVRAGEVKAFATTRGDFAARLTQIDLHCLWMQRGEASLPQVMHAAVDKRRSAILFPAEPDQASEFHRGIEVFSGEISWLSSGAEFHRRAAANSRWAALSLCPEDLAAAGRAVAGRELMAPAVTRVIRPQPALIQRLMNLHKAAAGLAHSAPEILVHPEVAKAMEQELVRTMVACLTAAGMADGSRSCRHGSAVMRRFEQVLEANEDEPVYIPEICAQIGVTDRMLRLYCQEHLGMGPHRYLWLRRMHLARRALALADARARTVTEIANDYGFGELGRFAVAYRRLFGESPSVTLRRPSDVPPKAGVRGSVAHFRNCIGKGLPFN
jgi:AraC-like DNA-binding protein